MAVRLDRASLDGLMLRIAAALVLFALPALADDIIGIASIVDGDTIWISDTKIRLWGIDAPETKQTCTREGKPWRCGQAATETLRQFIGTSTVTCEDHGKDRYGRLIIARHWRSVLRTNHFRDHPVLQCAPGGRDETDRSSYIHGLSCLRRSHR